MTITSLEKFKLEAGKSLNNQDLMFQSLKMLKQVNHQVETSYLITYDDKSNDGRKTRYEVHKNCLLQNMKQMAV